MTRLAVKYGHVQIVKYLCGSLELNRDLCFTVAELGTPVLLDTLYNILPRNKPMPLLSEEEYLSKLFDLTDTTLIKWWYQTLSEINIDSVCHWAMLYDNTRMVDHCQDHYTINKENVEEIRTRYGHTTNYSVVNNRFVKTSNVSFIERFVLTHQKK